MLEVVNTAIQITSVVTQSAAGIVGNTKPNSVVYLNNSIVFFNITATGAASGMIANCSSNTSLLLNSTQATGQLLGGTGSGYLLGNYGASYTL